MISIEVKDMTCGHCGYSIRKAIAAVDQGATVKIDLTARRVDIESSTADQHSLVEAVRTAGFTPGQVAKLAASAPAKDAGACCG